MSTNDNEGRLRRPGDSDTGATAASSSQHSARTSEGAGTVSGATAPAGRLGLDRESVVARQEERFGGVKLGSAFFGWLTATGMAAILLALLTAAGTAFSIANSAEVSQAAQQAGNAAQSGQTTQTAQTIGIAGAIALLVVLFVAYFCGGYVAGRMARFNGAKQGVAVWLWAVVIAVVVAVLAAVAGAQYNILAQLNLPRIPIDEGTLTTTGIVALVLVALAALLGAVLGGQTGMRYHRRVDRAGLGA